MGLTPHRDKLIAAINNPKANNDKSLLEEAFKQYELWSGELTKLSSKSDKRIEEMTVLLNRTARDRPETKRSGFYNWEKYILPIFT